MKKLMIACALACALAVPTVAGAVVIPGATYSGTFNTGTGGTIELVVSADGSSVEFNAGLFGQEGCAGNSLANERTITDDSFSLFVTGPPLVDVQGFFGTPGTVSGSARISGVCESGTQSWTAETPVVWPDGVIEHAAAGFAGEDIYNATGTDQTRKWSVHPGKAARFAVHVENEGTEADGIDVAGCGPSRGFRVKYTQTGDNVTKQVRSGSYQTAALATAESETIKLAIRATKKAKPGKTKSCKVAMSHSGVFRGSAAARTDAVKAVVKVKRG